MQKTGKITSHQTWFLSKGKQLEHVHGNYIYMEYTFFCLRNLLRMGGLLLFIVFIILIAGFLLYVLLKPPVDIKEEPVVMELRPEFKLSSLNLPEYSKNQSHSSLQAEEE
jgi:hypothetical protein